MPVADLPPDVRNGFCFVRLLALLDAAETVQDGHLLIAAFRLACAAGLDRDGSAP